MLEDKRYREAADVLVERVRDARERTLLLVSDLDDARLEVPHGEGINPPRWELGHIAYFFEVFFLRELGLESPVFPGADETFDSFHVAHGTRWALPLPTRNELLAYMENVRDAVVTRLEGDITPAETYLALLCTLHEDMHGEAFTYTRQALGYPAPRLSPASASVSALGPEDTGPLPGDVEVPGGSYQLGADRHAPFVFDNEKWAHDVELPPFRIARAPVTNEEYRAFVADDGYRRRELWSLDGWIAFSESGLEHPRYWTRDGNDWRRRYFDTIVPLEPHAPIVHVSWYEAEAFCNWAGRRLPTEAEWEMAASMEPGAATRRRYPWGDTNPTARHANLDGRHVGVVDVAAYPASDSAFGCRQMLGNVWEWTASAFYPFPGYLVDYPYREYSAPWFGYHKVLRGGAWATRSRVVHNTYRNFFLPHRSDIIAGFRTCAV